MQRKNHILKVYPSQRSAMAMIMAVGMVVIIGTIMALSLSFTAQTSKRSTDIYLHEQAILVSKSAAELALLDIARLGSCSTGATVNQRYLGNYRMDLNNNNNLNDDIFDVNITLGYIYDVALCAGATDYARVTTPEQNGSVMIDITVSTDAGTEPIRYFRRTLQKL